MAIITENNVEGMHTTDHGNDNVWTDSSRWSMGAASETTTETSITPTASQSTCEAASVVRKQSIHMNNHGLDQLIRGKLHEAWDAFSEADRLYQRASFLYCEDEDDCHNSQEYLSDWVNVQLLVDSLGQNHEMKQTLNHLFLYGLRIREPIHMINNNCANTARGKQEILRTSNMDWSIRFNLSLVTQFLGIVTSNDIAMECRADSFVTSNDIAMACRADSFDRYDLLAADVVAWYDGRAPLDAAILMMAVHNNQGSMYRQLQVVHQVEACWGRMGKILNASRSLQAHALCKTFIQNLTSFMNERTGPAPAA
eukprot:scaffold22578_cov164-Cylindrotheca_fusiformis.AAC.18